VTLQWLLHNIVKVAQYGQGIGYAGRPNSRADKAVLQLVKTDAPVIFDVGANRGDYLHLALTRLSQRHPSVHSFEPGSAAFAELQQRFGQHDRVSINNLALGSQPGLLALYYDTPGSELSSLYRRRLHHHGKLFAGSEQVCVDTLDNYCATRGIDHIDLLKLDVEGHELEVLKGAMQLFQRAAIRTVSFEFGGCNIDSRTFLRDFLDFFAAQRMNVARVTATGPLYRITRYEEALEQFRATCFVAQQD